jgi:predicted SAM-dependent methyltransferase
MKVSRILKASFFNWIADMSTDVEKKRLVNLGCGSRYHPDWINIDIAPRGAGVINHDLSKNIPLESSSCDVVYHSAVLEHIRPSDTEAFLRECKRVLKPCGILRVGVPDFENICELYLSKLQTAIDGDQSAANDYSWIILEMCDQLVRERSGGEMLAYLQQQPIPNEQFVFERIGEEGRNLVYSLRHSYTTQVVNKSGVVTLSSVAQRIAGLRRRLVEKISLMLLSCFLSADKMKAFEIGQFRLSGEVHQWVYDRYSLAKLLLAIGFRDPVRLTASTSQIPNWTSFNLDTLPDGTLIKPDLFYMEAIKP